MLHTLKGNEAGSFQTIAFSPDGKVLAAGASGPAAGVRYHKSGSTLQAWDAQSGELLWRQMEGSGGIGALDFSHDGRTLVVCDREALRFVDPRNGKTVSVLDYGQHLSYEQRPVTIANSVRGTAKRVRPKAQ